MGESSFECLLLLVVSWGIREFRVRSRFCFQVFWVDPSECSVRPVHGSANRAQPLVDANACYSSVTQGFGSTEFQGKFSLGTFLAGLIWLGERELSGRARRC